VGHTLVVFLAFMALIHVPPVRWSVGDVPAAVRAADALMADPRAHGDYGEPHGSPTRPLPPALRFRGVRSVRVGPDEVTVAWHPTVFYTWGYMLVVASERTRAERERELTLRSGSYQRSRQLAPRAWSVDFWQ